MARFRSVKLSLSGSGFSPALGSSSGARISQLAVRLRAVSRNAVKRVGTFLVSPRVIFASAPVYWMGGTCFFTVKVKSTGPFKRTLSGLSLEARSSRCRVSTGCLVFVNQRDSNRGSLIWKLRVFPFLSSGIRSIPPSCPLSSRA